MNNEINMEMKEKTTSISGAIKNAMDERPAGLLMSAYALGIVLFVRIHSVIGLVDAVLMNGKYSSKDLKTGDFERVGMEIVDDYCAITETNDGQFIYTGNILNLYVKCDYSATPGEFVAFYNKHGDYSFGTDRMVYAKMYGDYYVYEFPLGTKQIRFDQGVVPSITFNYYEITINKFNFREATHFNTGELFWLAVVPPLALAGFMTISEISEKLLKKKK